MDIENISFGKLLSYLTREKRELSDLLSTKHKVTRYCPINKKNISVYSNGVQKDIDRFNYLSNNKAITIVFDLIIEHIEGLYKEIKVRKNKDTLIFNINKVDVFTILFTKNTLAFKLLESFMRVPIEKLCLIGFCKSNKRDYSIKHFHYNNKFDFVTLNDTRYLVGVNQYLINSAKVNIIERFVDYVIEKLIPIFNRSSSFVDLYNNSVDYFVTEKYNRIYVTSFKEKVIVNIVKPRADYDIKDFSNIKKDFYRSLKSLGKASLEDYTLVLKEKWKTSLFLLFG